MTQAQWHQVASADDVLWEDGQIVGVVEGGREIYFTPQTERQNQTTVYADSQ